ncbi:MAG: TonB-dependent receptor [Halioglobus sp.]|nr:TonB-dependent receptor [Halioglobus sp.]
MKRLAVCAGFALSFSSCPVLAANLYLMVFFGDAPLSGATVFLDERNLGATDDRGSSEAVLESGDHVLTLVDRNDNTDFPIEFSSAPQEDVEIKVTFATGDEPQVAIRKFGVEGGLGEGFITGKILDASGAAVAGATIAAANSNYAVTSDEFGVYALKIPRGEYAINISAPGYQTVSVPDVRVMADIGVNATVTLRSQGETAAAAGVAGGASTPSPPIEEVFVLGVFNPQENAASVERYAVSITNAIDAAQLERFGDSDIGSALNRVVGVAIVDRKYATVRGLDGRYISSTLNGLLMPSTDTQRREVELDLFPTVIVGGIDIQKSYTADQLATTTGGAIQIETKGIPDERILQVSGSLGYNPGATGTDILSYASSNGDWAGYDTGLRKLPNGVLDVTDGGRSLTVCDPAIDPVRCTSPAEAAQLGVKFQDDYKVGDKTGLPNTEVSMAYGDRLPAGENEWGYYLAADFDRKTVDRGNAELTNPLGVEGNYKRSEETTAITGYGAVGYEYGDANELMSKTMYLHNTDDITRVETGVDQLEDNQTDVYLLDWIEREFISQSLTGHNEFDFDHGIHQLDWRGAYSETRRDEPDRRTYTYFNDFLSSSAFERRWSKLKETSKDLGADYAIDLDWGSNSATQIKVGGMWSDKDRTFDQYRFGIDFTEFGSDIDLNIDQSLEDEILPYNNFAINKVLLTTNTTDTDSYNSQEEIKAGYLTANTDFGENWTLLAGARFEKFNQKLQYPNDPRVNSELDYDDWYPAVNLTWRPTEEIQVRAGYSQTVSYPGIIERSEAQTYDDKTDERVFGNPDLEVSTIDNSDLRLEYYFSDVESVSLAYFYKSIDNPVEKAVVDASGSAARNSYTFINQESADLWGIEIDGTKNVLETDDYLVFVSGNVSYIDSSVDLTARSKELEGSSADGRELQGQSQWLSNLQVGMDHYPTEQKFTLLVNYFDKRIFRVARGANTGPKYEDSRVIVDFTYEKEWNENLVLEGSIKNILNSKVEYSQNDNTIESYNVGRFFKVGVTYTF